VTLLESIEAYRQAAQPWPATAEQIAEWAVDAGLSGFDDNLPRCLAVELMAEDLTRAMRRATFIDPQGRKVRMFHSVKR